MSEEKLEDLNITAEEFSRITEALKKDEFRKLFIEYCEELNDPEVRKKYEEELTQLESERGVDVTFINPKPGFVIKTSVDGQKKCFINVAQCDKINRPTHENCVNEKTREQGTNWKVPYTQAPPRKDYDKKNVECVVYDVVFHPEALELAKSSKQFKQLVIDTACDGVQSNFNVQLDRNNLKFPKIKFIGLSRPTIIRKQSENPPDDITPSPIDQIYPKLVTEKSTKIKETKRDEINCYTTPRYTITQRRDVDLQEFVDEKHAKLNTSIPNELVIKIELPLLKTINDVTLDVTEKEIYLLSEQPTRYKLKLQLPYTVSESEGNAKYDKGKKTLIITLPVIKKINLNNFDIYKQREHHQKKRQSDDDHCEEIVASTNNVVEDEDEIDEKMKNTENLGTFLDPSQSYKLPEFIVTQSNNVIEIKFNVPNIDPSSIDIQMDTSNSTESLRQSKIHIQFFSIGPGYFPVNFSWYCQSTAIDLLELISKDVSNDCFTVRLRGNIKHNKEYFIGIDSDSARTMYKF